MTKCNGRFMLYALMFLLVLIALPCAAAETPISDTAKEEPAYEVANDTADDDLQGMPIIEDVTIEAQADIVRDAQKRLAGLGFYIGAIDGKYGRYSEDAVRAFQSQYGLSETGQLDDPTLSLIT